MLHVGWFSSQNSVSERQNVTCSGSISQSGMSTQQTSCLKHVLHWAWRSTHARLREAHAMHPGGAPLRTYVPPHHHGCSVRYCTQHGRSRMGSVHAANGAQTLHGSTVLLVESPAKAKKLQLFLGNEYKVLWTSVISACQRLQRCASRT